MSGARSIDGAVTKTDRLAMIYQRPVPALTTLRARNNLQHLVDMASGQYRINWCASTSNSEFGGLGELAQLTNYSYVFPTTITDRSTLPSYDLRVATRLTGTLASATLQAALNVYFVTPTSNQNLKTHTYPTILSSSATWHDADIELNREWRAFTSPNLAFYADVGAGPYLESTPDSYVLVRLEIQARAEDPIDGSVQIIGVHLREYL